METMITENQMEKTTEIEMEPGIRWAVLKNYGPLLATEYIAAPNIKAYQNWTLILGSRGCYLQLAVVGNQMETQLESDMKADRLYGLVIGPFYRL